MYQMCKKTEYTKFVPGKHYLDPYSPYRGKCAHVDHY
jgi:hypothetical protein